MGAGVHHGIWRIILRKVNVTGTPVEGKLQDPRSRDTELVAKRGNVRRDYAQILSKEWQGAQPTLNGAEKLVAGTGPPFAGFCCRRPCWYMPGGRERAEMIDTNRVDVRQ